MQKTAREWSPGTVLAGTVLMSAFPLVAVEVFPELKFVITRTSYLLFHNVAEFFSVMVSLSMFGIGWYTYDQSKNRHALFLSTAFLGIGLMDFMHTLANAAMPPFITPNSSNKSTQFWIAVRLFQAVAFLVSAYVYSESRGRWLSKKALMTSALLISFLVFTGITFFPAYWPATFVPGTGLTPFKKTSEYLIIGMLCAAALAYWRRMTRTGDRLLIYYTAAFVICIFSELPLAVYTKVFGTYNVLGHIYKVAAFYLIYHGIYRASVKAPYIGLAEVGEKLKGEIVERKRTEEALRQAHDHLDFRVRERTAELAQSNAQLRTEVEDRRKAEEALREAHDRALWLARFPDENPNPVVRVSADGTVLYCNPSAVELHGWTCAVGQLLDDRLLPLASLAMTEGEERVQDIEIGRRFYSVWVAPFLEEGYANIYGRDITERKQTEEELRLAYGRLQTFFDHRIGGIGVVIANAKGDILQANDYYLNILGSTREELLSGRIDWRRVTPPEWLPADERALDQLRDRGVCDTYEKEYMRRDRTRVPVLITDAMMPGDSGDILAFVLDITERKQAEEAIRASLREKEVLLKEIHHRVKNNMQVISSLVALQADEVQDPAMRAVLQDVTHRVRSMALVHEKLYQSADLALVELDEYARSLLNYLWRAHGSAASGVRLSLDLEPVFLSVNEAVPCGLILNELVTNALKHAFSGHGHAEGVVAVSLRGGPQGQVGLCVRDNGAGLPAGVDWREARTLGLRLVQMLAGQLHAAVEVSSNEGTEFRISFEGTKK
jgi:PAS domain S-box-containing protein